MEQFISHSAPETQRLAAEFGRHLQPNSIVCFYGDLGAGKTTFIKGLASGILGGSGDEVNSPTFTYLNIYRGRMNLYHFDLYRLRDVDEFLSMGFDEMFDAGGVCCVEWAEKLVPLQLPNVISIELSYIDETSRSILITRKTDD